MRKMYLKVKQWVINLFTNRKSIEADAKGLIVLRNYIPKDVYIEELGMYLIPLKKVKNGGNMLSHRQTDEALFISSKGATVLMRYNPTAVVFEGKPYLTLKKRL